MVLDDVLSAIDARTEQLVVGRLFGKRGLVRRLGTTVILATHAGIIVVQLPNSESSMLISPFK